MYTLIRILLAVVFAITRIVAASSNADAAQAQALGTCPYSGGYDCPANAKYPVPAALTCGPNGKLTSPSPSAGFPCKAANFPSCRDGCFFDDKCISFSYNGASRSCTHYTLSLKAMGFTSSGTSEIDQPRYWATACFETFGCPIVRDGSFEDGPIYEGEMGYDGTPPGIWACTTYEADDRCRKVKQDVNADYSYLCAAQVGLPYVECNKTKPGYNYIGGGAKAVILSLVPGGSVILYQNLVNIKPHTKYALRFAVALVYRADSYLYDGLVVFLGDDMVYNDLPCYGRDEQSKPMCTKSGAGLMWLSFKLPWTSDNETTKQLRLQWASESGQNGAGDMYLDMVTLEDYNLDGP